MFGIGAFFAPSYVSARPYRYAAVLIIIFFLLFVFLTFFPIWYVVVGSFNLGKDYAAGGVYFFPRVWSLTNYKYVLSYHAIWKGFLVTIGRVVLATGGHIIVTFMVAHAMSRPYLRFKKFYTPFITPLSAFISASTNPPYAAHDKKCGRYVTN